MVNDSREHEVSFCAEVKSWADALFAQHPEWPFGGAHIEKYGKGTNKRQDLRVLDREHRTPLLSGEVKMPGTPEGRSLYDPDLMKDAYDKADDIAASIWHSLGDDDKGPPLHEWLETLKAKRQGVHIPDGKAKALGKGHMFCPAGVDFAQGKTVHHETYAHPAQAALVALLANLEIRGEVELPADEGACVEWHKAIEKRLADARTGFDALAGSRTGTQTLRDAAAGLLMQWFLHGHG